VPGRGSNRAIPGMYQKRDDRRVAAGLADNLMHHPRMSPSFNPSGCDALAQPMRKNLPNPKKLLRSKWTAVTPVNKEKHFIVIRVLEPEPPEVRVEWVEIEAVYSGRVSLVRWRALADGQQWRQGWL
jgi:tryptophan-rich hypothetical protein